MPCSFYNILSSCPK
jgi:hypothetical protein